MKNIISIIVILLVLSLGVTVYLLKPKEVQFNNLEFEQNIKEFTKNSKIIDANFDHNQALDVADFAISKGIKIPKILINFDTHSDITLNEDVVPLGADVDNWINEYLAIYPEADEVYWVIPKEEDDRIDLRMFFGENKSRDLPYNTMFYGNSIKEDMRMKFLFTPLSKKSYTQEVLVDPKTGKLNEFAQNLSITKVLFNPEIKYKKVKITTCTEETLPDFDGKEVFLSIDADYISNSGFDTPGKFINDKNYKQIEQALFKMVKTIKDKNIRPQVINLTLSPQYLPEDDHNQLIDFYNKIFRISGKQDAVSTYSRKYKI